MLDASLEQGVLEGEEEVTGVAIGTTGGAGSTKPCPPLVINDFFRSRGYVVKLNGLPFRASEREVEDWLAEAADPVEVIIEMDRLIVTYY